MPHHTSSLIGPSCSALRPPLSQTSPSRLRTAFRLPLRCTATTASSATRVAEEFLCKFAHCKPFIRKQVLDANQVRLLSLMLGRPYLHQSLSGSSLEDEPPKAGTPLPPLYHLVYFTPAQLPGTLGLDG